MKRLLIVLLCLGLLIIEPFLFNLRFADKLEENEQISVSEFFLRFLGEIRYTIASYLWLNVEIYHHELGLTEISSRLPPATDTKKIGEIVGLCKLVTLLDPHFIQAYDIGSWRLIQGMGKTKEGITFLKEGLANNPDNHELHEALGQLYFLGLKDCPDALPYLMKASALASNNRFEKQLDLRMLAACYEKVRKNNQALQTWEEFLKIVPGDTTALSQIKKLKNQ